MTNIIAFEPRRHGPVSTQAPELRCVLHLHDENCDIEMTVQDDAGNIITILQYTLTSKPEDFDLDRLRMAWDDWRGSSTVAS